MPRRPRWFTADARRPSRSRSRLPDGLLGYLGEEEPLLEEMPDFLLEDEEDEDPFWDLEGECVGCDLFTTLDDIGLCGDCAAKLDRDMIRERDWERSSTAWLCPQERREALRAKVIKDFGAKLELIAPSKPPPSKRRRRRQKKKKPKP